MGSPDASRRARDQLQSRGLLTSEEDHGSGKVLGAAAWTYVAGTLASVGTTCHVRIASVRVGRPHRLGLAPLTLFATVADTAGSTLPFSATVAQMADRPYRLAGQARSGAGLVHEEVVDCLGHTGVCPVPGVLLSIDRDEHAIF